MAKIDNVWVDQHGALGNFIRTKYEKGEATYVGASIMTSKWETLEDLDPVFLRFNSNTTTWYVSNAQLKDADGVWVALWKGRPGMGGTELDRQYLEISEPIEPETEPTIWNKIIPDVKIEDKILVGVGLVAVIFVALAITKVVD